MGVTNHPPPPHPHHLTSKISFFVFSAQFIHSTFTILVTPLSKFQDLQMINIWDITSHPCVALFDFVMKIVLHLLWLACSHSYFIDVLPLLSSTEIDHLKEKSTVILDRYYNSISHQKKERPTGTTGSGFLNCIFVYIFWHF